MLVNGKGVALVLAGLSLAGLIAFVDLRCSGDPEPSSTLSRVKGELDAGRRERRYQEAENLAALARDLRALARRYTEKGEKRKAHRAIGAAQELDRRIRELRQP